MSMKKTISILLLLMCITLMLQAQVSKTVNVTAGGLAAALTASEKSTITTLTVIGTIDASDFRIMRDSMTVLETIDLKETTVAAYEGSKGTINWDYPSPAIYSYPENAIPQYAFCHSQWQVGKKTLKSISIPSSVTTIGINAFTDCRYLTTVLFSGTKLTTLEIVSFSKCKSLKTIVVPEGVTSIEESAFAECDSLLSAKLPESLISIGDMAFYKCKSLLDITIPSKVSVLGQMSFRECLKIQTITILAPLTVIQPATFYDCNGLLSITLPETVKWIGNNAFYRCLSMPTIDLPESLDSIGPESFVNCAKMKSITIPASVKKIGAWAFNNNPGLETIVFLPKNAIIDRWAFSTIGNLKSFFVTSETPIDLSNYVDVFFVTHFDATLYVPKGSKNAYEAAEQWTDFYDIVELSDLSVTANKLDVSASVGSSVTVDVISDDDWAVSSDQSWLSVTPLSGKGNATITFTTLANTSNTTRIATVTIAGENSIPQEIILTQAAASVTITVSQNTVSVAKEGNSVASVTVTSNTSWTASSDQEWLAISPSSGTGDGTLQFRVAANPLATMRTAIVTISAAGATTKTIIVTQDAALPTLLVSQSTVSFFREENSVDSITVTSNTSWTASSDQEWLAISPSSGTGDGTLQFSAGANSLATVRTAIVTVSSTGATTQTITVTQPGKVGNSIFNLENITLFPNPVSEGFVIRGLQGCAAFSMFDLNGELLFSRVICDREFIATSELAKGVYLVRVITAEGRIEKKLIKE